MKPRIGLFAGGIEQYWKETGMKNLRSRIDEDAGRLAAALGEESEVVYPGLAENADESARIGKILRQQGVDLALMYHATYVDDAMSIAFIEELGDIFPVLFLSQGFRSFTEMMDLTDAGRSWGNNSCVQLPGTLKRMKPDFRFGFVFGGLDDARALGEIGEYARAAKAVRNLKGKLVAFLPHRSLGVPMYDTFPDETKMMGQTGVRIDYLYIIDLVREMESVSGSEVEALVEELYGKYEVVEPTREEVQLSARQALGLERLAKRRRVDALAVDFAAGMITHTGMLPCVGMARLTDQGVVVTTEGDLSVAIAGLIIREICGKPIHFWEHLAFDAERNLVLGGHEGGSAGFSMAKHGTRPRLRGTQYINFDGIPGAPHNGVIPEFITNPGPATLLTFYRGPEAYEMRIACGESVDLDPLPVCYEHTVFKPAIALVDYFGRIAETGVCHHFALVHADIGRELAKVARILGMKVESLT